MERELLGDILSLQQNQNGRKNAAVKMLSPNVQRSMLKEFCKEDPDLLNDETFGVTDEIPELSDAWEKQHEQLSKFIEIEHESIKKSSPLRYNHSSMDTSGSSDSYYEKSSMFKNSGQAFHSSSDDEEEKIIGETISQLGLDDEQSYAVQNNSIRSPSFEFEESKESWNSPSRGKEPHTDSLQELISPGEGIWASPSRAMLRDHVVPDIDMKKKEGEDIIKKLFGGHDIKAACKDGKVPKMQAIHAEDLERGLPGTPNADMRSKTPLSGSYPMQSPLPSMAPGILQFPVGTPPPGFTVPAMGRIPSPRFNQIPVDMASYFMMNKQVSQLHGIPNMAGTSLLSPQYFARHPFLATPESFIRQRSPHDHHSNRGNWKYRGRGGGNYRSNNNQRSSERTWHRYPKQPSEYSKEQEEFMQMAPSKMMTAKEKEWIFKISLMSLLSGDPNISDYYFVSYMNKKLLETTADEEEVRSAQDEVSENLEKTKQLMTYAQKNQQAKESYKPVKFEGSLGKLSITSVHHPRQIMDFTTPETDIKTKSCAPDSGKKKFAMYGLIEKMYDMLLSVSDVEHRFIDATPQEQDAILEERSQCLNKMFDMLKIQTHSSQDVLECDHFLQMMSISKARKLLSRIFLLFHQVQSESVLIAILQTLPSLLKKDKKDQVLLPLDTKVRIMICKSKETFKMKCVHLLRKVNLKLLLTNQFSLRLLTTILNSLDDKDMSTNLEWSYYTGEVPKVMFELSADIKTELEKELDALKSVLNIKDLLINIGE